MSKCTVLSFVFLFLLIMPTTQLITATSKWFGFTDPQEDFLGKQEITNAISEAETIPESLAGLYAGGSDPDIVYYYNSSMGQWKPLIPNTSQEVLNIENPHPYPDYCNETWLIQHSNAMYVRMHFAYIETESEWDHIYVRDKSGTVLNDFSGNFSDIWSTWAQTDTLQIHLTSDSSIAYRGFVADKLEWIASPSSTQKEPINIESPHSYPNNYNETWTITRSDALWMRVHFARINTERKYDNVYVKDHRGVILDIFTGDHENVWSKWIPGNSLQIQLITDYDTTSYGFVADQIEWTHETIHFFPLDFAILSLTVYDGHLYAGTMSKSTIADSVGYVYRYDGSDQGGAIWTPVGGGLDKQVSCLVVYKNSLYAGTAGERGRLYRYIETSGWIMVVDYQGWKGIRSAYVWEKDNLLYLGDYEYDKIGRYDETTFEDLVDLDGSCIWNFESYNGHLYASAYEGSLYVSDDGINWSQVYKNADNRNIWALETFRGNLYLGMDYNGYGTEEAQLWKYSETSLELVWTQNVDNDYEGILSLMAYNDILFIGIGGESGKYQAKGCGRVYAYDGIQATPISDTLGYGVQVLFASAPEPSYPSDKWERIWYVNNGNGEFGSYLGLGPNQLYLDFDDSWGYSTISYDRSDYIGFVSSRTINVASGTWKFNVTTDDGVRIYIDDILVLNKWFNQYSTYTFERTFPSTGDYRFRLEWYEEYATACISFEMEKTPLHSVYLRSRTTEGEKNIGTIVLDGINYPLPNSTGKETGIYAASAIPPGSYSFHHWEKYGEVSINDNYTNPTQVKILGKCNLTAVFFLDIRLCFSQGEKYYPLRGLDFDHDGSINRNAEIVNANPQLYHLEDIDCDDGKVNGFGLDAPTYVYSKSYETYRIVQYWIYYAMDNKKTFGLDLGHEHDFENIYLWVDNDHIIRKASLNQHLWRNNYERSLSIFGSPPKAIWVAVEESGHAMILVTPLSHNLIKPDNSFTLPDTPVFPFKWQCDPSAIAILYPWRIYDGSNPTDDGFGNPSLLRTGVNYDLVVTPTNWFRVADAIASVGKIALEKQAIENIKFATAFAGATWKNTILLDFFSDMSVSLNSPVLLASNYPYGHFLLDRQIVRLYLEAPWLRKDFLNPEEPFDRKGFSWMITKWMLKSIALTTSLLAPPIINLVLPAACSFVADLLIDPVNSTIIDSNENIIGLRNGNWVNEIPGVLVLWRDPEFELFLAFGNSSSLEYRFQTSVQTTYALSFDAIYPDNSTVSFNATSIPIQGTSVHTYQIDWDVLKVGGNGTKVSIDQDGDGTLEEVLQVGSNFTEEQLIAGIDHQILWNSQTFHVITFSNSTITNFTWDPTQLRLIFEATGTSGTIAYCNITIPKELLRCNNTSEWHVIVGSNQLSLDPSKIKQNSTHTSIYFTFTYGSTVEIQVIGTIPEFSIATLLLIFAVLSLCFVMLSKMRYKGKTDMKHPPQSKMRLLYERADFGECGDFLH